MIFFCTQVDAFLFVTLLFLLSTVAFSVPEGAEAWHEDDRRGARRVPRAERRQGRPAQDPGHRRWLRARQLRPE